MSSSNNLKGRIHDEKRRSCHSKGDYGKKTELFSNERSSGAYRILFCRKRNFGDSAKKGGSSSLPIFMLLYV
ncbi:MAG: hypothetical protein WC682_04560 [Parcubacteria group bacterium]